MPTGGFDLYHMQDAKNNFDAVRPAPVCTETNQFMGQCQNIHVSTNCYYGYHGAKWTTSSQNEVDCEMMEVPFRAHTSQKASTIHNIPRKRSADDEAHPQNKRLKEELLLIEIATNLKLEASFTALESQCDEVRLYFRGYGANDSYPQPMFATPNSQQSRYFSLSHEVQRKRNIEPETNENLGLDSNSQELLENLYWHIHGGNICHLLM